MSEPLKIATILGTRPEIIRLSCVMQALDECPGVEQIIVHTGQNFDFELSEVFFNDLSLRSPDYHFDIDKSSLARGIAGIVVETEQVLQKEKPDAVLILGDTNSSLAAIVAKRMHIPIYHMEAGNRSFDGNVPEEVNRKIVDHISDFNLVYTEHARRHLLSEGLPHRRIYLTGSPMREVLDCHAEAIDSSTILEAESLTEGEYFLVSLHREENVDYPDHLESLVQTLNSLSDEYGFPVIVSLHPRTRNRLAELDLKMHELVRLMKPFGFIDYNKLQKNAFCVLSDSGTISEESSILQFPAVTVRNSLERPEAMDSGSIILTGLDPEIISSSVKLVRSEFTAKGVPDAPTDYCITDTSQRVVKLILGTARLSRSWSGVRYRS